MGRALLAVGVVFGVLGLLWNLFLVGALALVAALGAAEILVISYLGFAASGVGILGGIVGRRRATLGSALLGGSGGVALLGLPIFLLLRPEVEASLVEGLQLSLLLGWWAYGLVVGGAIGLAGAWRRGTAS